MHFHWLPPSHPAHPQVFVTHLRGEELGKILLMTKRFQWGCTKCGKLSLFNTNLKQKKSERLSKKEIFLLLSSCLFFCSFSQVFNFLGCPLEQPSMAQCSTRTEPGNLGVPAVFLPLIDIPFQLFHSLLAF